MMDLRYRRDPDSDEKERSGRTMGKHIIIAGRMGSGKTTVERELTARGYRRIATYTTRPHRSGGAECRTA